MAVLGGAVFAVLGTFFIVDALLDRSWGWLVGAGLAAGVVCLAFGAAALHGVWTSGHDHGTSR
jgi:hypothetical protein